MPAASAAVPPQCSGASAGEPEAGEAAPSPMDARGAEAGAASVPGTGLPPESHAAGPDLGSGGDVILDQVDLEQQRQILRDIRARGGAGAPDPGPNPKRPREGAAVAGSGGKRGGGRGRPRVGDVRQPSVAAMFARAAPQS